MLLYFGGLAVGCPCNLVLTVSTLFGVQKYTKRDRRYLISSGTEQCRGRGWKGSNAQADTDICNQTMRFECARGLQNNNRRNNGSKIDQVSLPVHNKVGDGAPHSSCQQDLQYASRKS